MMKAGYARLPITPGPEVGLMGYAFRQESLPAGNDGVHDPLYARALVLEDEGVRAALVSLDVAVLVTATARALRREVGEAIGTTAGRVMIGCTHTHSGPDLSEIDVGYETGEKARPETRGADSPEGRYFETLRAKAVEAAVRAAGLLYPVRAEAQEAALGIGYNRRVATGEGGVAHLWNTGEQADLEPGPTPDPTCTALVLRQTAGRRRYVVWSVGAHGVVLGKTSRVVSADWPGAACGAIEARVPGARAMFLAGAAGDVHPWIATQEDAGNVWTVGEAAGAFVALLTEGTRGGAEGLATAERRVEIAGVELDVSAWRVGPCRLVALPVELFSGLGAALRRRVGGPLVVATVTNGWEGYWPTREAFAAGGYEVEIARRKGLEAGDGERLVEVAAEVAAGLG
jgi:hypothetical protein